MADPFENYEKGLESPYDAAASITPDDNNDLGRHTRAIYVGSAGNVEVNMVTSGSGIVFVGMLAGTSYPIRVKRVLAGSTTASSLVGTW